MFSDTDVKSGRPRANGAYPGGVPNRESILAPAPTGAMERPAMEDLGVA
ncbi:hypothetical protein PCS70012_02310 [Streptococcus pneumoniae PCS70012]|nr:hypothetical protein PCS70012_02310 [Streptococcus pneumoniae PCS70012]